MIGPAFLSSKSSIDDLPVLDFVPLKTTDALVSGGGDPTAKMPAPAPAPKPEPQPPPRPEPQLPAPRPEPKRVPEPAPVREPPREVAQPKPEPDEAPPERKPRKVEISTKLVERNRDAKAEAKAKAEARAQEEARQWARSQRRLAREFDQLARTVGDEMSGETAVKLKGPGGGGVPYANFMQSVKSVYERAWVAPNGVTDSDAVAEAEITIARDGTVLSANLSRPSGNAQVDRSVEAALNRVKFAAPLPDDAPEAQRTVTINFRAKAKPKRLAG